MAKTAVYNLKKESVGEVNLSDAIFGTPVNEALLYDMVKAQLASRRGGNATVKNRAARQGTKKKIYKQKGTGNARHGTKRAPIFVGGGVAHGPKARDYSYRLTRKMRQGALASALSHKQAEGKVAIIDNWDCEIKTKAVSAVIAQFDAKSAVVVDKPENFNLRMSIRNMPKHQFLPPEGVNVYDILRHEYLFITKEALSAIEARFAPKATTPKSTIEDGE